MKITPYSPNTETAFAEACEVTGFSRLLFISGQVPADESQVVPPDYPSQYRLAWANVERLTRVNTRPVNSPCTDSARRSALSWQATELACWSWQLARPIRNTLTICWKTRELCLGKTLDERRRMRSPASSSGRSKAGEIRLLLTGALDFGYCSIGWRRGW